MDEVNTAGASLSETVVHSKDLPGVRGDHPRGVPPLPALQVGVFQEIVRLLTPGDLRPKPTIVSAGTRRSAKWLLFSVRSASPILSPCSSCASGIS